MAKLEFFFYELFLKAKSGKTISLMKVLQTIKKETKMHKPNYIKDKSGSRTCLSIYNDKATIEGFFFYGKMIHSQNPKEFKEEKQGELGELRLNGDSGIAQARKDIIYFVIFINKLEQRFIVMLEYRPFSPHISMLRDYIKEYIKSDIEELEYQQKLGRDLKGILSAVKGNNLTLASIRFKKNIPIEKVKQLGYVEVALENLKRKELDFELILHWGGKDKKVKLTEFITQFFKIHDFSELEQTNFGEFMKTLDFEIDNVALPRINLMDNILRYEFPEEKENYTETEIFDRITEFFQQNIGKILT